MSEPTKDDDLPVSPEPEKPVGPKPKTIAPTFKVSEKGAVSVYGLGRFPVTLYYEQWIRLIGYAEQLKSFLEENKPKLKLKEDN